MQNISTKPLEPESDPFYLLKCMNLQRDKELQEKTDEERRRLRQEDEWLTKNLSDNRTYTR